ncbi:MAG: hypothetical protein JXA25_11120 [Anaerolineales bacterium]|nr:hypothetical protein [Anaerolineales bacterium]
MSEQSMQQEPITRSEEQRTHPGWLVAGGCLAALVLFCVLIGILMGVGWWHFDGNILQNLTPMDKYSFLEQWWQTLRQLFWGEQNQLQIIDVEDLFRDDLENAVELFYLRDEQYEDLLDWAVVGEENEGSPVPLAGTWMALSNEQEITGLLYQSGDDQFLTVQSWLPEEDSAETFLLWLSDAGGEPVLFLRNTEGRIKVHAEGLVDGSGLLNEEIFANSSPRTGMKNPALQFASYQENACETTVWRDYQNCLSGNLAQWGYTPDSDCVPDLQASQRVWDGEAVLIPGAILRSLVQCGSPAVQCLPAALDNPPQGEVVEGPVLLTGETWRSCQDEESMIISAVNEITIAWRDDREPFSEDGEQVYRFPGSEYDFSVMDCGGNSGFIGEQAVQSDEEDIRTCGKAEYCLEVVEGEAVCVPIPETPVPVEVSPENVTTATPTGFLEDPGEVIQLAGTIHRRTGACSLLGGLCSLEENSFIFQYPQNGAAAEGNAVYRESYPSGDCGPNQADYRFSLEGVAGPGAAFELEWTVERVITLQAGARGFCRGTSSTYRDSGTSTAYYEGESRYQGEIAISSGEIFLYDFAP